MSLTDAIISLMVGVMIVLMLAASYFAYVTIVKTQLAQTELSNQSVVALNTFSRYVRGATDILDSATINSTEYTTDQHTLIVRIPAIDSNSDIITDSYDTIVFYMDPGNPQLLKYNLEPDELSSRISQNRVIHTLISTFNINYNSATFSGADKVEVILVASKSTSRGTVDFISQTTLTLRNN